MVSLVLNFLKRKKLKIIEIAQDILSNEALSKLPSNQKLLFNKVLIRGY